MGFRIFSGILLLIQIIFLQTSQAQTQVSVAAKAKATTLTTSSVQSAIFRNFEQLTSSSLPKETRYQGIIVGVVTPFETFWLPFGTIAENGEPPSPLTLFEIGSITKGFLGLALAKDIVEGRIQQDQSVKSISGLPLPSFNNQSITWAHLATHTSGLPRVPTNLKPSDPYQPYLDYNLNKLTDFLIDYKLPQIPGSQFEYSNLGAGIVGLALEQLHGLPLEEVLRLHVLDKIGLENTRIFLGKDFQREFPPVHLNGQVIPPWQWFPQSVLQGAASLKSNLNDMMILLRTMMGLQNQEFLPVVSKAIAPLFDQVKGEESIGLFWHRFNRENIVWHNGGTYGSSSFIGFDPNHLVGIIALSNSQFINQSGVDQRLTLTSLRALKDLIEVTAPHIQRPFKVLQDYDFELARQRSEFAKTPADPSNKTWAAQKIHHMRDIEQMMRRLSDKDYELGFNADEKTYYRSAFLNRFKMMDWQNTEDLKQLLKIHGWFRISEFGKETDSAAWLIVQHADHDPTFQKEVLRALEILYPIMETRPDNYAYLWDRVAVSPYYPTLRQPQRYGTQGSCTGPGTWEPHPIENDGRDVDLRRREVGLEPLSEYIKRFKDICH